MQLTKQITKHLISASRIVSPMDWKLPEILDNDSKNKNLYLQYNRPSSRTHILFSWEDNSLQLVEKGQRLVLLNHNDQRIEYYMQYEYGSFRSIKTITQIAIWAHQAFALPNIKGVSAIKWVFFNYLLPKAEAIAADSLQTEDGKKFWLRRLRDAWDKGLHTYLVLRDKNTVVEIKTTKELNALASYIWGTHVRYEFRRAFISKDELFSACVTVESFLLQEQKEEVSSRST
jgi:hypothetical protein